MKGMLAKKARNIGTSRTAWSSLEKVNEAARVDMPARPLSASLGARLGRYRCSDTPLDFSVADKVRHPGLYEDGMVCLLDVRIGCAKAH